MTKNIKHLFGTLGPLVSVVVVTLLIKTHFQGWSYKRRITICVFSKRLGGASWSWSYDIWINNYLCNQYLSPLTLWVRILLRRDVLDTTLCDKVCQWHATGQWFSPGTPVSSTNKTDRHDTTEILLKVTLNTINQPTNKIGFKLNRNIILLLKCDRHYLVTAWRNFDWHHYL